MFCTEKYGKGGKTAPNWTPWIKDMVEKDTTRDDVCLHALVFVGERSYLR